jgi:hypothetical protein
LLGYLASNAGRIESAMGANQSNVKKSSKLFVGGQSKAKQSKVKRKKSTKPSVGIFKQGGKK